MKKLLLILVVSVFSVTAIGRSVKIEYGEFDNDFRQLAEFENIELLKLRLVSDSVGADYNLVAVTVSPDSISEQLISTIMPIKLMQDTTEWNVFAKPLSNDSVKIGVPGTNCMAQIHQVSTPMAILLIYKAQTEFNNNEEIPLFAYAQGAEFEMEWQGEIVKGYNYCKVRDCGKHPSEWGKIFKLPTFVYYVLRPTE